jgi:hypothetical protein
MAIARKPKEFYRPYSKVFPGSGLRARPPKLQTRHNTIPAKRTYFSVHKVMFLGWICDRTRLHWCLQLAPDARWSRERLSALVVSWLFWTSGSTYAVRWFGKPGAADHGHPVRSSSGGQAFDLRISLVCSLAADEVYCLQSGTAGWVGERYPLGVYPIYGRKYVYFPVFPMSEMP